MTDLPAGTALRSRALQALRLSDPRQKVDAVQALAREAADLPVDAGADWPDPGDLPGRPSRTVLVPPAQLARRSPFTREGRQALLHALAHIEFNAINLALDAIWRFAGLPEAYYRDWLQVAAEEAHHFSLLCEHLASLDCRYADLPAHDGLWAMVEKTRGDVVARMALVPRTLEARGLDATPPMQARLRQAGDHRAVEILAVILRDEVGHVAIGNHWYRFLCAQRGLDPLAHYAELARRYEAPQPRPPFNLEARRRAGFTGEELALLDRPGEAR
jgi:uncharacterized ferritin-like protein (DUF455 family)